MIPWKMLQKGFLLILLNKERRYVMKDYVVSYSHSLGFAQISCYSWEIASILWNLAFMAVQGHTFSNVTINKV